MTEKININKNFYNNWDNSSFVSDTTEVCKGLWISNLEILAHT